MAETIKCRACGVDVPPDAPFGHCPQCLLQRGFDPPAEEAGGSRPAPAIKRRPFGGYELLEQIGRGGMGVVYKARQAGSNRLVALKMILASESATPILLQRFQIEAEAAAKLAHPNIVPIYEIGEHDGLPFFSMMLIEGTRLDRYITTAGFEMPQKEVPSGKLPVRETQLVIARLMTSIARAVRHAHQRGVLHRDLKPSNILLDAQGQPYLTDFGLAKMADCSHNITVTGVVLGTPSYMAPEQAAGYQHEITTASDIYSLGAILYEMLTGRPPFRANTPIETLRQVMESDPQDPQTRNKLIDRDLATICLKCLERDPLRRYESAGALADDLDRWQRQDRIRARPASLPLRARRWTRRNPRVAMVIAGLMLGLTGAVLLLNSSHQRVLEKENALQLVKSELANELNDLWAHPEKQKFVPISAEKRAFLMGGTAGKVQRRCKFGIYTHDQNPTAMLPVFARLLEYLEKTTSKHLKESVGIDFVIFRSYQDAMEALLHGEIDFARCGAASYIIARRMDPAVKLLIAQKHKNFMGVIFTQATNTAINTPQDVKGCSIAFGNINSTTGRQLARFYLAELGLHARDFSNFATNYLRNHADVTAAVRRGEFEVGAAKESYVKDDPALKILGSYPNIGMPWITKTNLSAEITDAIRRSLLPLQDTNVFNKLEDQVIGFEDKQDADYNELRGKMEKRLELFEQKARRLEEKLEALEGRAAEKPKAQPVLSIGQSGFTMRSADNDFALSLRGILQLDSRTYFDDGGISGNDGFVLRRLRPAFEGTLYRDFTFRLQPDFGGSGAPTIRDAYLNYRYDSSLQLRLGKFKTPVGLEQLQSDTGGFFVERSLVSNLLPSRDLGVQLHGELWPGKEPDTRSLGWSGVVNYAAGLFNGVGDSRMSSNVDFDDSKHVAGRLFFHPFLKSGPKPVKGLGLGVGSSLGQTHGAAGLPQNNGFATEGQQTFFTYLTSSKPLEPNVIADGTHWRVSPQGYWYWNRFGLFGEYAISGQQLRRVDLGTRGSVRNTAWQIAGSCMLTGETPGYKPTNPANPFNPHKNSWGAFEVVGRYSQLNVEDAVFPLFASPQVSAKRAAAWGAGLNWYLNRNIRTALDFIHTDFEGGSMGEVPRQDENVFLTRVQLTF